MTNLNRLYKIAQDLSNLGLEQESEEILDGIVETDTPETTIEETQSDIPTDDISGYETLQNLVMGILVDMQEHGNLQIVGDNLDQKSKDIFRNYVTNLIQTPLIS